MAFSSYRLFTKVRSFKRFNKRLVTALHRGCRSRVLAVDCISCSQEQFVFFKPSLLILLLLSFYNLCCNLTRKTSIKLIGKKNVNSSIMPDYLITSILQAIDSENGALPLRRKT